MMDPISFLQNLIAIESYSGEERGAADFLVREMKLLGFRAFIDEAGNALGIRDCPDPEGAISREIILLGHMDTVSGKIPVRVEDGRLYGRGAVDAKGPLAAFVMAASKAKLIPGTRVIVIGAVEEESATSRGARHVAGKYHPDWCIIGEPSGFDSVTLGYKGRLLIDYRLNQPMGHTAGPNPAVGERAIAWWNRLVKHINEFNAKHERLFDQILPSLREICTSSDGLVNFAYVKAGLRLPPGFDSREFEAIVRNWTQEGDLQFYGYEPAFRSGRQTSLAKSFNRALSQKGLRTHFKLKTGTSDMNVVGPIWRCPILAYGPGDSKLDHTPEEHIVLNEYLAAIQILELVLYNLGD